MDLGLITYNGRVAIKPNKIRPIKFNSRENLTFTFLSLQSLSRCLSNFPFLHLLSLISRDSQIIDLANTLWITYFSTTDSSIPILIFHSTFVMNSTLFSLKAIGLCICFIYIAECNFFHSNQDNAILTKVFQYFLIPLEPESCIYICRCSMRFTNINVFNLSCNRLIYWIANDKLL